MRWSQAVPCQKRLVGLTCRACWLPISVVLLANLLQAPSLPPAAAPRPSPLRGLSVGADPSQNPLIELDETLQLEQDVIAPLAGTGKMYVCETTDFWRQIKTAASAVAASALYLSKFAKERPSLLAPKADNIVGPVYIDATAHIDATARIGPNATIGPNVVVGEGARIANAIILDNSVIDKHAVVLNSIVGNNSRLGQWARVDGEPEPQVEKRGEISVSVLASDVHVAPETHIRSCIVLPNKNLPKNAYNQVLL